jgi:predicted esterase
MSEPQARLDEVAVPRQPSGVVLVLHGGREVGTGPVRRYQPAVLRMRPFGRRIARTAPGALTVFALRYRIRGWNGELESPLEDARAALDGLTARYPGRPIGLVGHSMGGRTALRVAGHPGVTAVVALAPWLPRGEPVEQCAGRRLLLVHGTADRTTSPALTEEYRHRLEQAGIPAGLIEISGAEHSMLRRARLWHELAAGFVAEALLDQSADPRVANLLHQASSGRTRITV